MAPATRSVLDSVLGGQHDLASNLHILSHRRGDHYAVAITAAESANPTVIIIFIESSPKKVVLAQRIALDRIELPADEQPLSGK